MWGRPHCSSLQGESEIETQHLRTHTGKKNKNKDTLPKLNREIETATPACISLEAINKAC